jgi:Papain-like cysteine protease AvrRpt2/Tectonin domain
MATLQKTFNYEGDSTKTPFKTIILDFNFPVFEFISNLEKRQTTIVRDEISLQRTSIIQKLSENKYTANIPGKYLIGDTESSVVNFLSYLSRIGLENDDTDLLNSLLVQFSVNISDESENLFAHFSIDALYTVATASDKYRKTISGIKKVMKATSLDKDKLKKLELQLVDYLKENIFLINNNVFTEIAVQCKFFLPGLNDYAFLNILSHLTELSNGKLVFKFVGQEFTTFLNEHFKEQAKTITRDIVPVLKDNFEKLLEFPITVPEIKTVEIKGTCKIITSDGSAVALSDFNFYDLAIEYAIASEENDSVPVSINYEWNNLASTDLSNNTVPVSFSPIIINELTSLIYVRVKGYDGSIVWEEEFAATNPNLQKLVIELPLLKPSVISTSDEPQPTAGNKKLQGKVVEMTGKCELKALTVVIQTKNANDSDWKTVGTAITDSAGNFSLPYPYGIYSAAQALVSLTPNSPAGIVIQTDVQHISLKETITDDFLYLLLKDVVCESKSKEDDCDCHEPKKSNRLPDQEELIKSDDYSQDIGGACINLSTPNRTLSEYSHRAIVRTSDPDVANYTLTKDEKGTFRLKGGETKINRKKVDLSNPIRWQDAPDNKDNLSLYQAVSVATGHILHYKIVMKADGYSMGELLYSLPLAPGQKKQIVMFEQTHTLRGSETQRISQNESLAASLVNEINITDTLGGSINESIAGSSSANTSGISAGLGLAGIIDGIAGTLGVAGGTANSNSSASQNSSRTVAQQFQEQLRNGITQNAQSYRELNASVITTVSEGQQYGVTSEVVANHNHCHSLTMMYFEVLRHYAIYQELSQVEECLFIPLLMTEFSRENIYKWRDVLAKHLLPMPSETYLQPFIKIKTGRQHPLLKAFDAIERIKTRYADVDFPEGAFCDEPITSISGYLTLRINIPRPKTIFDRILSFPIVKKESVTNANGGGLWGAIVDVAVGENNVTKTWEEKQKIANEHIIIYDNFQEAKPADVIEVVKFDNFFPSNSNDGKIWTVIANLCGYSSVENFLSNYFAHKTISKWDQVFNDEIVPKVFEALVRNSIAIDPFSQIDFTTTAKYHGGDVLMRLNLQANTSLARKDINQIRFTYTKSIAYPNEFWPFVTFNIQNINISYTTKHYIGLIINRFLGADLYDGTPNISTLMNADEQRNPKKEDEYVSKKLIEHLNSNIEHYNKALWRNLDQDRRYMLLDGFKIETYDDFGQPHGFRSLASVIKNELIGIAGNSLIMPVAPGYKIDRSYIIAPIIEGPEEELNLFEHYKPLTPSPPYRISIPSKGVFAEAVQGACDACEKVKENTSQDWEKFKTDEPTPINPVTTPVPTVTDWKAAFKDFATPIVNIQNAPAAPTPGAGLAGLSDLLGKSDSFRDITGLEGNQKNALQTYLSNQQSAKDFAQMAKDIFTQDNNTKHSDAIADSIRNSDVLSDQEKAELLKKHFNQVIDGGQSEKAAKEADAQNNQPTAMGIAADAENKGKPVKVATSDASGNTQSLEVGSGSSSQKERVTGTTYWVSQGEKTNACWAAAATMMKSWKDHKKYSIEEVLAMTPPEYLLKYTNNELLLVAEKDDFIAALAMVSEPPASYTFDTYIGWLEQYGPLWITIDSDTTTDKISPHAIILIGYDGDGTEQNSKFVFYDPSKTGEQTESFAEFDAKYGQMASDNPGTLMTQIVHFKDSIFGEGGSSSTVKLPEGPFATLIWESPGKAPFKYEFSTEDVLWLAQFLILESGGEDDIDNHATIWAMLNNFALSRSHLEKKELFHEFLRAYSPVTKRKIKGKIDEATKMLKSKWTNLEATAKKLAEDALKTGVNNPINYASKFLDTNYLYSKNKVKNGVDEIPPTVDEWEEYNTTRLQSDYTWIGNVPGLNQKGEHAFYTANSHLTLSSGKVQLINTKWDKFDTKKATDLSVGADGSFWIIGDIPEVGGFDINKREVNTWKKIANAAAVQICVDPNGNPWVINENEDIFRWDGNSFIPIPDKSKSIGIGLDGSVWMIGTTIMVDTNDYQIFRWNETDTKWDMVYGGGVKIAVDPFGTPYIIDSLGNLKYLDADNWEKIETLGKVTDFGIGSDGSIWLTGNKKINNDFEIYKLNKDKWELYKDGTALRVTVGIDGLAYVLNSSGLIYKRI